MYIKAFNEGSCARFVVPNNFYPDPDSFPENKIRIRIRPSLETGAGLSINTMDPDPINLKVNKKEILVIVYKIVSKNTERLNLNVQPRSGLDLF